MYGYYTPILLLQAFCLYHAYRQNNLQRWLWLIVFIPVIGCLIYLYDSFGTRINVGDVQEGMKAAMDSNYKTSKLEKEIKYAPTVKNKVRLADAYMGNNRVQEAMDLYKSCLNGLFASDTDLIRKLVKASYLVKDYAAAVQYGQQLKDEKIFRNSDERVAFSWSLYFLGQIADAENNFKDMDAQFSNFPHRFEYAKFLLDNQRPAEAKAKLEELLDEIEHMDAFEQRQKRPIQRNIKQLYSEIKV